MDKDNLSTADKFFPAQLILALQCGELSDYLRLVMEKVNTEFVERHSKIGALGLPPPHLVSAEGRFPFWSLSHLSTDVLVEHLGGQEELDGGLQDVVAAEEDGQGHLQDQPQHGGVEEVQEEGGRRLGRH